MLSSKWIWDPHVGSNFFLLPVPSKRYICLGHGLDALDAPCGMDCNICLLSPEPFTFKVIFYSTQTVSKLPSKITYKENSGCERNLRQGIPSFPRHTSGLQRQGIPSDVSALLSPSHPSVLHVVRWGHLQTLRLKVAVSVTRSHGHALAPVACI